MRPLNGVDVLPAMQTKKRNDSTTGGNNKRKKTGRFAVLNGFVDYSLRGLSKSELAAWLILYRDTREGIAKTSHSDIARRAGVSKRAITAAMRKLEKRGLVEVVYRGGIQRGVSRYRVLPQSRRPKPRTR
jgi:DNA-binding transcriptional ArsR family regulator